MESATAYMGLATQGKHASHCEQSAKATTTSLVRRAKELLTCLERSSKRTGLLKANSKGKRGESSLQ
ncbi:Hypothetical predicted protein [Podarcis lilfordi]|nr:Hypothetical predicted protein [Podarcis lilfordi]